MMRNLRTLALVGALVVALGAIGACGSSDKTSSGTSSTATKSSGKTGGKVTVLMGTAPDYLDPQLGYTTQSAEATWISYLGLYTYAHKSGADGGKVIPGLAQDFPKVSNGGKTYTLTLRQGLKYSDGSAVKASDFPYTIQRAIKTPWGGKSFFTGYIKGALDYDSGKAKHDLGHQGRRRVGQDHHRAHTALRGVPERPRLPVGGPGADRDEDVEPLQQPAARRRPVRDQERRPEPLVRRGSQPELDGQHRPRRAGRQGGHQRQDRVEHANRGRAGAQQPGRRLRLGRSAPAVVDRTGRQPGQGPVREAEHDLDVLLLPQHADEAVQQPARARGGQLRDRPPGAGAAERRQLQADLLVPTGGARRPPDRLLPVRRSRTPRRT